MNKNKLTIAVIDYNMGNLHSIVNAFNKINIHINIVKYPEELSKYDKIILPGVGAFKDAMEHLQESNMDLAIKEFSKTGKYMLGVCLGMQLLLDKSYEFGKTNGLGLIKGEVTALDKNLFNEHLKIPHIGWNKIFIEKNIKLFKDIPQNIFLYFLHSFHINCEKKYILGKTFYGYEFPSAINKDNIYGLQPHPEKSHKYGLQILKNFIEL